MSEGSLLYQSRILAGMPLTEVASVSGCDSYLHNSGRSTWSASRAALADNEALVLPILFQHAGADARLSHHANQLMNQKFKDEGKNWMPMPR